PDNYTLYGAAGAVVERAMYESALSTSAAEKGGYRHYMLKEIYEQPAVLAETLSGRVADGEIVADSLGAGARELLAQVKSVHIVACGTSYFAGLVARYWIEAQAGIACNVELASE